MMPRMSRLACCSLLVLAACPPKTGTQTAPPPIPPGAGCPSAANVYVASYVTQEADKGRSGWVLPLHSMKVEPGAAVPDYQQLDEAAASISGVPPAPTGNLWLVTGTGAPCPVKLGGHYAAKIDGPPASLSYGIEIDGCPAPADPDASGVVMVSMETPSGCLFQTPQPVASRLGEMVDQKWQKPAKETPIPLVLGPLVPAHDCQVPACEQLWSIGEVDVANQPVAWAGAVNWLTVGDPDKPCDWKAERFSGFFVPGPDGKPIAVTEGQDHSLALSTVFVDHSGAKVALAEGPGEYATYDLAAGKAPLGHHVTWMLAPPEAWESIDHLGPVCEAPEAKPAPLPKDAKPISPYQ